MLTVTICVGSSCSVRGSDDLAASLEKLIEKEKVQDQVELVGAFCMDECSTGVAVRINDQVFREIYPADAESFFYKQILPRIRNEEGA